MIKAEMKMFRKHYYQCAEVICRFWKGLFKEVKYLNSVKLLPKK